MKAPPIIPLELIAPEKGTGQARIRCPRCGWPSAPSSTWVCLSGPGPEPPFSSCGTVWNTFKTRGRCPGCAHQWRWTTCLHCTEWSPHLEWYEVVEE